MHNLNFNVAAKEYAFFSADKPAWHKLGQVTNGAKTSAEAMEIAHLNYPVYKIQNEITLGDKSIKVPGCYSIVNGETQAILTYPGTTVSDRYEVVQNAELFAYMDDLVGGKQAVFETAGALGKGEELFMSLKFPDTYRIGNSDDVIEKYLLLTSSHNKTGSIRVLFTDVRVVCQNTLRLALTSSDKITIKHTKNYRRKMSTLSQILGIRQRRSEEAKEVYTYLASKEVNDNIIDTALLKTFVSAAQIELINRRNGEYKEVLNKSTIMKIEEAKAFVYQGCGQDYHVNSGLWLFNGINSYLNNRPYKSDYDKYNDTLGGFTVAASNRAIKSILTELQ